MPTYSKTCQLSSHLPTWSSTVFLKIPRSFTWTCTSHLFNSSSSGQIVPVLLSLFGQFCCLIHLGPRGRIRSHSWKQGESRICSRMIPHPQETISAPHIRQSEQGWELPEEDNSSPAGLSQEWIRIVQNKSKMMG